MDATERGRTISVTEPSQNLTERIFLAIRRHSRAAESLLHTLCHFASQRDESLFVVGGLIRDVLLGLDSGPAQSLDIDLAIDGPVDPFVSALAEAAIEGPVVHERFGTASATLADGTGIDLARTRAERYVSPGALPSVTAAPIDADLRRRDFSINAMALPLTGRDAGTLLDPFGGVADLERRRIRTLHPVSFRDDPTRLIRAARYAARVGATIERRTASDARRERHHLQSLTPERFGDAWRLLLQEPKSVPALRIARRLKIPQSRDRRWTVPAAALRACDRPDLFWAGLGLLESDPTFSEWLPKSVGMRRSERSALDAGVSLRRLKRSLGNTRRASRTAEVLERVPDPALEAAARLWKGAAGASVSAYLLRRESVRSPISASDLIELGLQPGPELGEELRKIEALIWDAELDPEDRSSVARLKQRIRLSR